MAASVYSMENPVFAGMMFYGALVLLKLVAVSLLVTFRRVTLHVSEHSPSRVCRVHTFLGFFLNVSLLNLVEQIFCNEAFTITEYSVPFLSKCTTVT